MICQLAELWWTCFSLCYKLLPVFGIISSKVVLLEIIFLNLFFLLFCFVTVDHLEFMAKPRSARRPGENASFFVLFSVSPVVFLE